MTKPADQLDKDLEQAVIRAKAGERDALETVIQSVQSDVFGLALRFLWHPEDAEDATQEILIRVITGLGNFRGGSRFRTWVYRVACNRLLTLRKQQAEKRAMSFEEFADDLECNWNSVTIPLQPDIDEIMLLEEVKIGCTLAMLLCLDREHRLAYILGEIMELDHQEAAQVLEITPAAFRKRLSRSREKITTFMMARCGLINADNTCRCHHRLPTALNLGRVNPERLLFTSSLEIARKFPNVLVKIRELEDTRRAAALYRSHPQPESADSFVLWIRQVIEERPVVCAEGVVSER